MKKQQKHPVILLDQDGVLADFFQSALDIVGGNLDDIEFEKPWIYNVVTWMNFLTQRTPDDFDYMTYNKLWELCNDPNRNWWGNLPKYPWAQDLHTELRKMVYDEHHLIICTYPQPNQECYGQKIDWIKYNFPQHELNSVIMGKQKHLFAKPHHILIDDTDENVEKFIEHGGRAVLFPQPWNKAWAFEEGRIEFVLNAVRQHIKEIGELTV